MDNVLFFLKREYEAAGTVTPAIRVQMELARSASVSSIAVIDEHGVYAASLRPDMVATNAADRDFSLPM